MPSDTSGDELCFECGTPLIVINDPSEALVQSSSGFENFKDAIIALRGEYEEGTIDIAMCPGCASTTLLGPQVVIEGTIVDRNEE